jgi:hypothetical protein
MPDVGPIYWPSNTVASLSGELRVESPVAAAVIGGTVIDDTSGDPNAGVRFKCACDSIGLLNTFDLWSGKLVTRGGDAGCPLL